MSNLSYAPIPEWEHIAKSIVSKQLSDEKLAESWLLNNEKSYWFSRSAWSLYVLVKFRILRAQTIKLRFGCLVIFAMNLL